MAKRKNAPSALTANVDHKARGQEHKRIMNDTTEAEVVGDLRLSAIEYRDPGTLKPSPYNAVFDALKTPEYWKALRRDIEDAGTITDPLVIEPDGTILSGHSRQRVAAELLGEGRREFEKIPVRVVLSEFSDAEKKKRVYLGNLSRFEIDPDTRLALYAEIYPDYFDRSGTGRPKKGVTVTRLSVAQEMGVSEETAKKEKAVYQDAKEDAAAKGKAAPDRDDIAEARKKRNEDRKLQKALKGRKYHRSEVGGMETIVVGSRKKSVMRDDPVVIDEVFVAPENAPTVRIRGDKVTVDGIEVVRVRTGVVDTMHREGVVTFDGDTFRRDLKDWIANYIEGKEG